MHPDDLKFPALFHNGTVHFLQRSETFAGSWFGGPFEGQIAGGPSEKPALHHIATINGHCFDPLFHRVGGGNIQLFYGMTYQGCRLRYSNEDEIQLVQLAPKQPSPNWPYPRYPSYLPYFPLELKHALDCSFAEFCELSSQPLKEPSPTEVIILVPPSPVLGMSMWGPSGDLQGVQIIFRYDMETSITEGFNQCG